MNMTDKQPIACTLTTGDLRDRLASGSQRSITTRSVSRPR